VRAQQALQRSERQLQQLIDTVPAAIWCTTPEGIPCYLNKRATDVTGLTVKDLIASDGSRSLTVVHPDDRETFDQALARSIKTGTSFVGTYRQRRTDGPHRWVESRAEPLRDDSGKIVQWYGVTVDVHDLVTAQEALRDRERELSQLVNLGPILLWRVTAEGEATFYSKRLIDYLGLNVTDTDKPGMSRLAAHIQALVHPDDAVRVLEESKHSWRPAKTFTQSIVCAVRTACIAGWRVASNQSAVKTDVSSSGMAFSTTLTKNSMRRRRCGKPTPSSPRRRRPPASQSFRLRSHTR
jgi:PAS domain S-box-containing protein